MVVKEVVSVVDGDVEVVGVVVMVVVMVEVSDVVTLVVKDVLSSSEVEEEVEVDVRGSHVRHITGQTLLTVGAESRMKQKMLGTAEQKSGSG